MSDFVEWVNTVQQWGNMTYDIPRLAREDITKGRIKFEEAKRSLKSLLVDPLSIQYALGYKDRKYSLTYDVLKRIPHQLSIINAIIQTRCNQVAGFAVPYRNSKSIGFIIKHKDPAHLVTKSEQKVIQDIERFIYNCGQSEPNPHARFKRDDFESFLKKIVRDSLQFDQAVLEIVPDRRGLPYEFVAVDASTIRLAAKDSVFGPNDTYVARPIRIDAGLLDSQDRHPYKMVQLYNDIQRNGDWPAFVQIVNGQIENVYTHDEMAFGVRNPRTDIYIQGYGYSELEMLITIITSHLYAERYNQAFFSQGSSPKGILNFKGDNLTPDQLEGFKRQWRSNLEGVSGAWRTPILQAEQGVEWINLHPTNREMEFGQWMEYLLKISCAVFLIDPSELNFDLHGGVQQTPLFESSQEWKLKASRDRGLKPLLRFIAKLLNEKVVSKLDDHFVLDFVGLDELTEQEKHELRKEQVASYMTLNEIRRAEDLPDVADGDMILNPTYLQARQIKMQLDQQEQQSAGGGALSAPPEAAEAGGGGEGAESSPDKEAPQYADAFTKSQGTRILEVDLSDWIDKARL